MKPLLSTKVQRRDVAEPIREWELADHHMTIDGLVEFKARQQARIAAADKARNANSDEVSAKVKQINKRSKTA